MRAAVTGNEEHEPGRPRYVSAVAAFSSKRRQFLTLAARPLPGLVEKPLELESLVAEGFFALYREQFTPDLTVPDSVVEEWIAVGTFIAKEKKPPPCRNRSLIGRLPKAADADHQKSDLILKATSKGKT